MTEFSYITINVPEAVPYEFQPIKFHHVDFAAPHMDAPPVAPTPPDAPTDDPIDEPAPDHVVKDPDFGALHGTAGADEFTIDDSFDGAWIIYDFEPGKDKLLLDHAIFTDLPVGTLDAALIWQDGNDPAEVPAGVPLFFDGNATLAYNGHDIAVLAPGAFGSLAPSDIIVF